MTEREALALAFLHRSGWGAAQRNFLAGDASDRSYDRLRQGSETAVLMDAPPGRGDDPADFLRIAAHLRGIGLSAPQILAKDLPNGFLLIEDLGDALFARELHSAPQKEARLYTGATEVLLHLQNHAPPANLHDLSAKDWAEAAGFALDWYARAITGMVPVQRAAFTDALTQALHSHADGPRVLILRDYHAENLLDLPDRDGVARVGLLDFQLAQLGQPGYDLVSLLQDARRDVSPEVVQQMILHFAVSKGVQAATLETSLAVLGAQRALRILGIFARLCLVAGKSGYVDLIPRVWGQLQHNLAHKALADLKTICDAALPPPTPQALNRIKDQCAKTLR